VIGYDIDGVLADKPPQPTKTWGKSNGAERAARKQLLLDWYTTATPLLQPTEPFIAISARKETPETRAITEQWINQQPYGHLCVAIALLPLPRTVENTARFKTEIINHYQLTWYIEDNKQILKRLNTPNTQLWYWDKTLPTPEPYI
jgi:hypothetical protein